MNVIICGAGIAGLTLAWWLEQQGWQIQILEKAPGLHVNGYMIDFMGSGYDVAERMGILSKIKKIAYHIDEVTYINSTGNRIAEMKFGTFEKLLKGRLLSVMRNDLEKILFENLPKSVEIRFNSTIKEIFQDENYITAVLNDTTKVTADLLVGADGIHSRVRELVFGPQKNYLRYLGFHTAAYVFENEEVRRNLNNNFKILTAPGKEVGLYPLRNGQIASFFVHRATSESLPSNKCTELQKIYGNLGWSLPKALEECNKNTKIYYDIVAQIEMPKWRQGRVTLVGDACQAVSLLAGQGASMAMGGAYILANELKKNSNIDVALEKYETIVKPAIEEKQASGRKTANWFAPVNNYRIFARNTLMRIARIPGFSWILAIELLRSSRSIIKKR